MLNLKLAARTLLRTPFVSAVAIASLALGIGANTAIYSMFHQILLKPLPVPEPDRLVNLSSPGPRQGSSSCSSAGSCEAIFSYPMFRDLERGQKALAGLAAHRSLGANLAIRGQTSNGDAQVVSGGYFPTLLLVPALGRLLGPADDETLDGHPVVVLGYRYWETRLGADRGVLGESILVNGRSFTIVGVAPRGFNGTTLGDRPDVYLPLSMWNQVAAGFMSLESRRNYWLYLFGRLEAGGTTAAAVAGLNQLYRPLITDVEVPLQDGMTEQTLALFKAKAIELSEGARGQSNLASEAATPLAILFAVTGIVLLIACINVANLLMARAAGRSLEMAVRLSIGAGRRQLLGQLLTESCLLAVIAAAAGLLVAQGTLRLIVSFLPPDATSAMDFAISGPALLFALVLAIVTGLLFGLAPALRSTRPELLALVKSSGGRTSGARSTARFRSGLATAQMALSMALLCSAGLFLRSLGNTARVDLGVRVDDVVTFRISPVLNGYEASRSRGLFRRVEEQLATVPGVTSVAAARVPVLAGSQWGTNVEVEGFTHEPDANADSRYSQVGARFLETLGIPLLAGREFTDADDVGGPKVAIVNETFAARFGLGRDAVGKRMSVGSGGPLDIEIVGLMKDSKYSEVKGETPPVFYLPYRQDTTIGSITFYARTRGSAPVLREISTMISGLDRNLPVTHLLTLHQQVKNNIYFDRMISVFSAAFAGLATLLAAVGLYGVLAYAVVQRTREIGVRMALGADGSQVRAMVLRQVGWMVAVGGVIGIGAAVALGKAARSVLFGVTGTDPLAILGAAALLTLVALAAGYLPARRASRVHPMQALRYE